MSKEQILKIIDKFALYLLAFLAFAVPLFFLPITRDFYNWNKQILILTGGIIFLLLWSIKCLIEGEIQFYKREGSWKNAELALLIIPVLSIISTLINPASTEGLAGKSMLFGGLLLIYLGAHQLLISSKQNQKFLSYILYPLLTAVILLSILNILNFFKVPQKLLSIPGVGFLGWTPAGGQFALVTFSLAAIPITVFAVIREFKKDEADLKPSVFFFHFICLILTIASLTIFAINMLETQEMIGKEETKLENIAERSNYIQLPLQSGWKVATRLLGDAPQTAFFGVGPQNFENAFKKHKPVSILTTPLWNIVFARSTNEPLHILSTLGLLGLGAWAFLLFHFSRYIYKKKNAGGNINHIDISILTIFASQLLFPPTLLSWFLLYLFFTTVKTNPQSHKKTTLLLNFKTAAAGAVAFSSLLIYLTARSYAAETKIYKASQELMKDNVQKALSLQEEAIQLFPQNSQYHHRFAKTNLTIAQTIEPTEENLQNINRFLQYAKRGTEKAININRINADYWKTQGDIYWNLIGLHDGAVQQASDSYTQAISKDPLNPTLRVARGKVWGAKQNWDRAQEELVTALRIQPDLPSAWYNLGIILERQEDYQTAIKAFNKALETQTVGSGNYSIIKEKIATLENLSTDEEQQKEQPEEVETLLEENADQEASPSATTEENVEGATTSAPFSTLTD
ncbi:MAG: tetratricopeptide repeat protein [Patescibacteria group bacterium]